MLRTGRRGPQRLVRTFIAIELPERLRRDIRKAAEDLARRLAGVRWVEEENLHLTLKFLGDVQWDDTGRIGAAMKEEAAKFAPFELALEGVKAFPPNRPAHVIAVDAAGDGSMKGLFKALDGRLKEFGVRPENREFLPHLTLGRIKGDQPQGLSDALAPLGGKLFGSFEVEEITFFQSELSREGPTYTCLCRAELAGPDAGGGDSEGGSESQS